MKKLNRNDLSLILGGVEEGQGPTPFKSGGSGGGGSGGPCVITCSNGLTLDGGPECPTSSNQNEICQEIGGGNSASSCQCYST